MRRMLSKSWSAILVQTKGSELWFVTAVERPMACWSSRGEVDALSDQGFGQGGDPALHEIEPEGGGRGDVERDSGPLGRPVCG